MSLDHAKSVADKLSGGEFFDLNWPIFSLFCFLNNHHFEIKIIAMIFVRRLSVSKVS